MALDADLTQDVFTGKEANEGRIKTMDLSNRKVIVFATHGLVPGDLNGLTQPALALSSPAVAGGEDDGILTMGEILGLRLDADWVVLSACNTAAAEGAGAEGWGIGAPSRTFIPELQERWPNVTAIELSDRTPLSEVELVRETADRYDAVIAGVFVRTASFSGRMDLSDPLVDLLRRLSRKSAATGKPFVTVSTTASRCLSL